MSSPDSAPVNFIRNIISEDLAANRNNGRLATRFPPEPNGYLHIGHAKSICLNFGVAAEHPGATCNLRFDDTNPGREEAEYVDSIREDVQWLGFDWDDRLFYTSDYFERLYEYARQLIEMGKAYVCDLSPEDARKYRGTLTEAGRNSPFRDRPVKENLDLFERMRAGEFEDGARVLRARIDMASPNLIMRDPTLYRIRREDHHRTGSKWCIYPMYDFAHCLSDSIEGITHSLCTLEFENNRELYDWLLDQLKVECHPRQIEFARLNLSYTVLSKRKLVEIVNEGHVTGWDDPRMPTLSGLRRRGYTPRSIRNFCERIGVARRDSMVDMALLEYSVREDLNRHAPRVMGVLRPLKVVITNYPEDKVDHLDAVNNPEDPAMGSRKVPFSRVLYIEKDDFREDPPKKFFRLAPGREVRLRYAFFIKCVDVVRDEKTGEEFNEEYFYLERSFPWGQRDSGEDKKREFLEVEKENKKGAQLLETPKIDSVQLYLKEIGKLKEYENLFDDVRWRKGIELMQESYREVAVSYSLEFYEKDENDKDQQIILTLTSL